MTIYQMYRAYKAGKRLYIAKKKIPIFLLGKRFLFSTRRIFWASSLKQAQKKFTGWTIKRIIK